MLSQQILANLKRLPHCLLLTRVGQFYESYFDQAVEIARLLNIKLTSRKWNGDRIAMCGFPLIHLDKHLKTLVQLEKRFVAMCEEFPRSTPNTNVKEFDRRISRIITPGTLIDESFLDPRNNNYVLAVTPPDISEDLKMTGLVGLAWMDVSTGQFFSKQCDVENLQDELARIDPREVVLHSSLIRITNHPILAMLTDNLWDSLSPDQIGAKQGSADTESSLESIQEKFFSKSCLSLRSRETLSIQLLTDFLQANLLEHMPILDNPIHESTQQLMQIDSHTIHALEIRENDYEHGTKGSLLSVVKRTSTSGGARLLARWICSPSTSVPEINARQSLVDIFCRRAHFRADLCELLKEVEDIERLCQKFLLGRAEFADLVSIQSTIDRWDNIHRRIKQEKKMEGIENPDTFSEDNWRNLDALFRRMSNVDDLASKISNAIIIPVVSSSEINDLDMDDDLPRTEDSVIDNTDLMCDQSNDKKWTINPYYSEKSASLHANLKRLSEQKAALQQELCSKYFAPSLTLRSSPGNGFFIHLSRAKRDKSRIDDDPEFYGIGETLSTKSYFHRPWSDLGNSIVETSSALASAEKEIFQNLRLEVIENIRLLRQNSQVIDELDVALSFSILATEMNFVRPEITDDGSYKVINGRHPTVEIGLLSMGRQFVPNSVQMTEDSNMHIITGPNMAGKSTLLRQTALITILAQVGSFVPADYAHIGVVDKLFSRIGARDDLFRDRSTFMVEMLETADILRRATYKSLVIMDEVGRGTTVKDGLAIAFGALHHLITTNKSRCLFATHFHELAEMVGNVDNIQGSGAFQNVRFYCSDVDDAGDGHFAYAYRLKPGINHDSHGLKVAGLAGMPPAAMDIAADTLAWLKGKEANEGRFNYDEFIRVSCKFT
ncbi:hypothetical protein HYPSUDRAFT_1067724 [Hypholoma sublateritium FD-334 SS-4]|uniref:DNA mismatch repair proteins mutS family domain-containing protein n=1 Tax=Hypholoma sublateritium (strain FD-334 SS-4) TaxID=945553 RepID=A0A0D2MQ99_HYPSF|nr:hypothetical protein HYPSUDRAFT_1067724 [Hypholoma sublateritium FD-334 SS-4]